MSGVVATAQQKLMGKYKPYPEYKDSEVEWLHSIPKYWLSTKVKYGFDITLGKMLTKEPKDSSYELKPYLKAINIQPEGVNVSTVEKMWFSPSEIKSLRLKRNDVLISEGGDVGRAAIWNEELPECYIQNAVNRAKALKKHSPRFFYYWVLFLKQSGYIEILCNKATIAHYTAEKVEASPLLLPIEDEQHNIAAFLDYETARIDRLIAQQLQLIELLKEKRQAVISHAVTKGLNPNAPMKDSGIEWLGQIPDHWLSNRVGWCCQVGNGCTPSRDNMDYWSEGTYPWLNSGKVNDGYIISAEQFVTVTALKECSLPKVPAGSIVMAITGEGKTRGSVAMTGIDTTLSQHLAFITVTSKKLSPMYLRIWLESQYQRIRFESEGWGSTKAAITCSDIKSYPLPEPPLNEQLKIVEYVGERSKTFDLLIQKSESMISVLQERRIALISAAVTGKIDLRGWTPPAEEVAA
ncbi:restriction endonuclease subunit S [Aeromonas salmonicida]|uniref:restriction endonuclease subunit S n=1 Tax=Aeromonas salmonicida TaxID=645 RepID=UPI001F2C46E1|nr:restriction endonuclease subunit S [Aeromonas salmonicida]MCE9935689.1 restriction endonuclease subunit S [Aeromonas salmonicida]